MRVYRNPALGFTIGGGTNSGSQVEVNFSQVIYVTLSYLVQSQV